MTERFTLLDMLDKGFIRGSDGVWVRNKEKPTKCPKVSQIEGKAPKTAHKYNAKGKDVDGTHYDSQREYRFKQMLDWNKIPYAMKEVFMIQEGFEYLDEKIIPIKIIPDFIIYNRKEIIAVVDIKGMVLPDFKIKMKMLKSFFKKYVKEIPVFLPTNNTEMQEAIREILK